MRISDWSSDVCSSDLLRRHLPLRPVPATVRRHLLAQQGLFDRLDMVVHESTDALDQILCARAVGKVHRGSLLGGPANFAPSWRGAEAADATQTGIATGRQRA